jgi:hypothetical protein
MATLREWSIYSNRPGHGRYLIEGSDLATAVAGHFRRIAADAGIGDAGGYTLERVRLERAPANETIDGHPYGRLVIAARGQSIMPPGPRPTRETIVRIAARPEDIPAAGLELTP